MGSRTPPGPHPAPDPGLFGPDSVTWHLHSDPMMWIAGVRALYLQALHPAAVRGVMINSTFMADPWGRLNRTADFIGTLTYGTTDAAERAAARVRRVHRLLGVDDPDLLLWVHCAEVGSYLHVLRRSGLPLDDTLADRYLTEQRTSARLVGLDPAQVPGTTAELTAYFTATRPVLATGEDARAVAVFLRRPPVPAPLLPARALLWRRVADLAYHSLPPHAHALHGVPAPPPDTVTRRLTATGSLLRRVPGRIRWQRPPRHIPKAMARLGPGSRPAPYTLSGQGAILDGPGRARRTDGGDSTRWRTPG